MIENVYGKLLDFGQTVSRSNRNVWGELLDF
jgi:hypothetical protein